MSVLPVQAGAAQQFPSSPAALVFANADLRALILRALSGTGDELHERAIVQVATLQIHVARIQRPWDELRPNHIRRADLIRGKQGRLYHAKLQWMERADDLARELGNIRGQLFSLRRLLEAGDPTVALGKLWRSLRRKSIAAKVASCALCNRVHEGLFQAEEQRAEARRAYRRARDYPDYT